MLQVTVAADQTRMVHLANLWHWSRQRMYLVLRRATQKTGRWVYTRVVRHIADRTQIKQQTVRRRYVRLSLPKEHFPVAKIKIMDKGSPLIELHPKRTETGIAFTAPGGGSEERAGAFKATMPRGHVGIFARKGRPRLPIGEQYKSVVIESIRGLIGEVQVDARQRLAMEIQRQVDVMTRQMAGGVRMRRRSEVGMSR